MVIEGGGGQVGPAVQEVLAEHAVHGPVLAVARLSAAVLGGHFAAFVVVLQDDVDHTGHSVGAVNSRCAAGDDFNVVDQSRRNRVQIDRRAAGVAANVALAVDQRQGARGAQATQVGEVQAAIIAEAVGVAANSRICAQRRKLGEDVTEVLRTGVINSFARNGRNRGRLLEVRARNTRAGDDDFIDFSSLTTSSLTCGRLLCNSNTCREKRYRRYYCARREHEISRSSHQGDNPHSLQLLKVVPRAMRPI